MLTYLRKDNIPLQIAFAGWLILCFASVVLVAYGVFGHSSLAFCAGLLCVPVEMVLAVILVVDDFMIIRERVPEEVGLSALHSERIFNNINGDPPVSLARLSVYDSFFVLKMLDAIVWHFSDVTSLTIEGRYIIVGSPARDRPIRFWASKAARETMAARYASCSQM